MANDGCKTYRVWDRPVRIFHWLNVITVLGLLGVGLIIYNGKALGISADAKLALKSAHVWIGYLMAANLAWRFSWGFVGKGFARWRAILPFGRGYLQDLNAYGQSLRGGAPRAYLGHNPLGRLMVFALLVLLTIEAATGLVLAGTDLYYPPLGSWIASWVAAPGIDSAGLLPGNKAMVDAAAWSDMRAFRAPYMALHEIGFYLLGGAALLHIVAVAFAEIKDRSGLVSAMIHGNKTLAGQPVDLPVAAQPRVGDVHPGEANIRLG